jgi:hypothetical protein
MSPITKSPNYTPPNPISQSFLYTSLSRYPDADESLRFLKLPCQELPYSAFLDTTHGQNVSGFHAHNAHPYPADNRHAIDHPLLPTRPPPLLRASDRSGYPPARTFQALRGFRRKPRPAPPLRAGDSSGEHSRGRPQADATSPRKKPSGAFS